MLQETEVRRSPDRFLPRPQGEHAPEAAPHAEREDDQVHEAKRPHLTRNLPTDPGGYDEHFSRADTGEEERLARGKACAAGRSHCDRRKRGGSSRRAGCPDVHEPGSGLPSQNSGKLPEETGKRDTVAPQCAEGGESPELDFRGEEIVPGTGLFSGPGVS